MPRETRTAIELVDIVRKGVGDRSLPIMIRHGASPSDWRLEIPLSGGADRETLKRLQVIEEQLRELYDLEVMAAS